MAAYTDQPPRSRRFIKVYLATWASLDGVDAGTSVAAAGKASARPVSKVAKPDADEDLRWAIGCLQLLMKAMGILMNGHFRASRKHAQRWLCGAIAWAGI